MYPMMTNPPRIELPVPQRQAEADWTPLETAKDWRRRAELFWKLSKLFDDLAVRTRNCAHWCDHQAAEWDAVGVEQAEH
jgi:hypothetical protein